LIGKHFSARLFSHPLTQNVSTMKSEKASPQKNLKAYCYYQNCV